MYAFKLDLPTLPTKFSLRYLDKKNLKISDGYGKIRDYIDTDKQKKHSITTARYLVDTDLEEWIKENISDSHHKIIVAMHEKNQNDSDIFAAHTDKTRSWVLIYYVRTGGSKATLNFYQEKNTNIIRDLNIYSYNYNDLKKIESHYPKDGEWWLLNTLVLHDVQNIDSMRLAIQVSFWNETVRSIKSQQIKHLF